MTKLSIDAEMPDLEDAYERGHSYKLRVGDIVTVRHRDGVFRLQRLHVDVHAHPWVTHAIVLAMVNGEPQQEMEVHPSWLKPVPIE